MMMTLGSSMVIMVKHGRKILRKNFTRFSPLPRINVGKNYASNADAELMKKSDAKILFGFFDPPSP